REKVCTRLDGNGNIQTCYLMHITVDTIAEIPDAKENWLAGSRCDVLEDGGHVYMLSNGREWVEVNFYNLGGESDSTDLSDYYTMSQTDERLSEYSKTIDLPINWYKVNNVDKGAVIPPYSNNIASGKNSVSIGFLNTASGDYSFATGMNSESSGKCSFSTGMNCAASGGYSFSGGYGASARGSSSFSFGYNTNARSSYSVAFGDSSNAEGSSSFATGYRASALSSYQFVTGKCNSEDRNNKFAFIIGNGSSSTSRQNAFAIDWSGNIYVDNSDTPVNVLDLLNRLSVLESKIAELENSENT
ncbi:MAG: hypothetical protein K2H89_11820, partial [Oscillospiraceae bacterium]|nr:hypothetical protein [Oscillospiraceae bacterium]